MPFPILKRYIDNTICLQEQKDGTPEDVTADVESKLIFDTTHSSKGTCNKGAFMSLRKCVFA